MLCRKLTDFFSSLGYHLTILMKMGSNIFYYLTSATHNFSCITKALSNFRTAFSFRFSKILTSFHNISCVQGSLFFWSKKFRNFNKPHLTIGLLLLCYFTKIHLWIHIFYTFQVFNHVIKIFLLNSPEFILIKLHYLL